MFFVVKYSFFVVKYTQFEAFDCSESWYVHGLKWGRGEGRKWREGVLLAALFM